MAFEEYGTQDGSGFPYSNIYFIDTAKNTYAATRVAVQIEKDNADETTARSRAAALAAVKLKKFGIVKGNTGKLVVSHLQTDLTFDDRSGDGGDGRVKFAEEVWSMHIEGDHELVLTPVKVKIKDCSVYDQDPVMMELKLTDNAAKTSKFLQKDTSLPATRGCPNSYRIQDVYLYKGLVAVFMGVFTQGFEGPDMRFMAAVGQLK